jgi:hypothetical protein
MIKNALGKSYLAVQAALTCAASNGGPVAIVSWDTSRMCPMARFANASPKNGN